MFVFSLSKFVGKFIIGRVFGQTIKIVKSYPLYKGLTRKSERISRMIKVVEWRCEEIFQDKTTFSLKTIRKPKVISILN